MPTPGARGARTRAAPRRPCPRRAAGSTGGASTARRPRTPRRRRRASRAGGDPHGVEQPPAVAAGQRGEGHRRVRRPERGGAESRAIGTPSSSATIPEAMHARGLALVVRGADGRVALDVLDRAQPGADGAGDVGDRRVALQVDELGAPARAGRVRHAPQHQRCGAAARSSTTGSGPSAGSKPAGLALPGPRAARRPGTRPGRTDPLPHPLRPRRRAARAGTKAPRRVVVAQPARPG